jgi:transcription elongation factor GreA
LFNQEVTVGIRTTDAVGGLYHFLERLLAMSTIPLTVRGAELMKTELHQLKTVDRPAVIMAIAEARAQGDLSENAEYDAAKERQGFIEGRIIDLEGKLSNAQIIDPAMLDAEGRIVFGATVELEELRTSERVIYQIVGDDEADIRASKISVSSPIARALIGKHEGDVAQVKAPAGVREYEVLAVRYV